MIVVADDFTGAAEMGGVASRRVMACEVQVTFQANASADLIVVDTDTRSRAANVAIRRVAEVARRIRQEAAPQRRFKKVDSVLRGHVGAELGALLEIWDKRRALLVPANPGLGRIVTEGRYFVDGHPLHQTDFSRDPEYPAATSNVLDILGTTTSCPLYVLSPEETMPDRGIIVGEATSETDLTAWATRLDDETLPAGAAEFFAAFLRTTGFRSTDEGAPDAELSDWTNALFVCGSPSSATRAFCETCEAESIPVLRMPLRLFSLLKTGDNAASSSKLVRKWAGETVRALRISSRVVVTIDRPLSRRPGLPQRLSRHLAELVEQVLDRCDLNHILVTGGATAVALVRRLGWERLRVRQELATGVVCMQAGGQTRPLLTMKPGSYSWPEGVLGLSS